MKNFTTDWNDGLALCSMIEAVAPGLCPEYNSLDPDDHLANARLGLDRAEEGLGVPKVNFAWFNHFNNSLKLIIIDLNLYRSIHNPSSIIIDNHIVPR